MNHSAAELLLLLIAATTACSFLLVTNAQQELKRHDQNIIRAESGCSPLERDALLAFKQGITNDICGDLDSWWLGHDCCNWAGVTCSRRNNGHVNVIMLDLGCSDLSGCYLTGQISPSLLSLEYLEYLDLSFNYLEGPNKTLPEFLASMTKLRHLDLSYIQFSGTVPSLLSNLTNLRYLNLSFTSFFGILPSQLGNLSNLQYLDLGYMDMVYSDISWLSHLQLLEHLNMTSMNLSLAGDWSHVLNSIPSIKVVNLQGCSLPSTKQALKHLNLTKLQHLDLSRNSLHQLVASSWFWNITSIERLFLSRTNLYGPFLPDSLRYLTILLYLDLSDNSITGSIPPRIGNSSTLMSLDLSDNYLSGHVPSTLWMCLRNLTTLDLSHNNLDGVITEEHISTLVRLNYIDLSHNSLKILVSSEWLPPFRLEEAHFASCQMGPHFPAWLKSQAQISVLDISSTGIVDELPDWVFTTFLYSKYLDFSNNQISGAMPSNLTAIVEMEELYINSNLLSGQVPLLPGGLSRLDISQNSLSGPLPIEFGAHYISELIMYSNNITGHIPKSICDMESLLVLDLSNNSIDGEYPRCFGMSSIVFLLLSNNALSGNFPPSLRNYSQLAFLDLSWNNFSGTLPMWIGDLVYLRFLQLSHNRFFGGVPMTITTLKRLQHLNLAGNTMSGAIPSTLVSLQAMTQKHPKRPGIDIYIWYLMEFGKFKDVISVVLKRQELKYGAGIFKMVGIDLSLNQFTGGIPDEITSLNGLVNLNLSWNHLVGQIPGKIGSIKSMESLDLSRNNLSGEIPPSLSDLTYLSYLDLSYNNLTGQIPQGRQLDTLYLQIPSMYDGNSGLCGPPLQRNCSGTSSNSQVIHGQVTREKTSEVCFFYTGLGSGFMVGLWVVFCAMLFKKTWRTAYFRFVNRAYDKVYVLVVVTCGRLARDGTTD